MRRSSNAVLRTAHPGKRPIASVVERHVRTQGRDAKIGVPVGIEGAHGVALPGETAALGRIDERHCTAGNTAIFQQAIPKVHAGREQRRLRSGVLVQHGTQQEAGLPRETASPPRPRRVPALGPVAARSPHRGDQQGDGYAPHTCCVCHEPGKSDLGEPGAIGSIASLGGGSTRHCYDAFGASSNALADKWGPTVAQAFGFPARLGGRSATRARSQLDRHGSG